MKDKIHSFGSSSRKGKVGEERFLEVFKDLEALPKGIKGPDFKVAGEDLLVELKTDYYSMETGNFFMEVYSDMEKQTLGGPAQALEKGSKVFCYYYIKSGDLFIFKDLKKLVKTIDKVKANGRECKIKNKSYTTLGYAIKRDEFSKLYSQVNINELSPGKFKELLKE